MDKRESLHFADRNDQPNDQTEKDEDTEKTDPIQSDNEVIRFFENIASKEATPEYSKTEEPG